ncbi:hypothetical protein ACWDRX_39410, partial [Streptomyces nigra]
ADVSALKALDIDLARELQAAGRAPWQILAGAWRGWCASGWTRCTSPGCAPAPGSRSATCSART